MNKKVVKIKGIVTSQMHLVIRVLLATVLIGLLTWIICFKSLRTVSGLPEGKSVIIIGQVKEVYSGSQKNCYRLVDPSGDIWVVTDRGNPAVDTYLFMRGTTSRTKSGRPVCNEGWRLGTF